MTICTFLPMDDGQALVDLGPDRLNLARADQ
jgi:hypothetical protein